MGSHCSRGALPHERLTRKGDPFRGEWRSDRQGAAREGSIPGAAPFRGDGDDTDDAPEITLRMTPIRRGSNDLDDAVSATGDNLDDVVAPNVPQCHRPSWLRRPAASRSSAPFCRAARAICGRLRQSVLSATTMVSRARSFRLGWWPPRSFEVLQDEGVANPQRLAVDLVAAITLVVLDPGVVSDRNALLLHRVPNDRTVALLQVTSPICDEGCWISPSARFT